MTRQRIIFIAILILALAVLLWDKTRSGSASSPTAAEAAAVYPQRDLLTAPPAATPQGSAESQKMQKILAALTRPSPDYDSQFHSAVPRNLFRPQENFLLQARSIAQDQDLAGPAAARQKTQLDAYRSKKLLGTLIQPGASCANIDGQIVSLGQFIGPARLVSIFPDRVVLQNKDEFITIGQESPGP